MFGLEECCDQRRKEPEDRCSDWRVLRPKTDRSGKNRRESEQDGSAETKDGKNRRESEQDGSAETKDGENRRELERSGTDRSRDSDKHFMGFS